MFGHFQGYTYVKSVMTNMNIESGEACDTYIERISNRQTQDKQRKSSKDFKHKRRKLLVARRVKGKQHDKKEGVTYDTGIASELSSLQDEVSKMIKNITVRVSKHQVETPHYYCTIILKLYLCYSLL